MLQSPQIHHNPMTAWRHTHTHPFQLFILSRWNGLLALHMHSRPPYTATNSTRIMSMCGCVYTHTRPHTYIYTLIAWCILFDAEWRQWDSPVKAVELGAMLGELVLSESTSPVKHLLAHTGSWPSLPGQPSLRPYCLVNYYKLRPLYFRILNGVCVNIINSSF